MQAYIDFFYITNETTPSFIEPSDKLIKEYQLNKRRKGRFVQNQDSLTDLSDRLIEGENYMREDGASKQCFKTYEEVARMFEALDDWETASYFYKRILDVSID